MKNISENKKINRLENNFLTIEKHSDWVNNIIILSDGRLSSCSKDCSINIYNKDNYEVDIQIKDNKDIKYHLELSNKNIISCGGKTLKIYEIKNNDYNLINTIEDDENVNKVIELENNKLITSGYKKIKVWKFENNQYKCINTIEIWEYGDLTNILKINENKLVSSSGQNHIMKFFDLNNDFKELSTLTLVKPFIICYCMCMVDDQNLLLGGVNEIALVNINTYQLISHNLLNYSTNLYIQSIIKLRNGNILTGFNFDCTGKYCLCEYKFENNNLIEIKSKKSAHEKILYLD